MAADHPPIIRVKRREELVAALKLRTAPIVIEDEELARPFERCADENRPPYWGEASFGKSGEAGWGSTRSRRRCRYRADAAQEPGPAARIGRLTRALRITCGSLMEWRRWRASISRSGTRCRWRWNLHNDRSEGAVRPRYGGGQNAFSPACGRDH
jgi:hypothetical protein